jgi:hypothetical protein
MSDDYFSDYVFTKPIQAEKEVVASQLTTPAQKAYQAPPVPPPAVGAPQGGPLPPGFQMPAIPTPNVQAPPLPSTDQPLQVQAPQLDVQQIAKQAKELKKEIGPAKAKSVMDSEYFLPGLGGLGLLAGAAAVGYGLSKTERKSIPDRDIRKIEPLMDVNTQPTPGVTEPTFKNNDFSFPSNETVGSTIPTPEDITQTSGYQKLQNLENVANGPLPNEDEATLIRNSERNKASNLVAEQAGVTPETTPAEADTIVASREAALDPKEKAAQKQEIKGAVEPKTKGKVFKEIPEGMMFLEGANGYTNWLYNTHKGRMNAIINEFNGGKYPQTQEEASLLNKKYNEKYGGTNRGPVIPKEIAIERGIEPYPPGRTLGKTGTYLGKAGMLAAIADVANATQESYKTGEINPILSKLFDFAQAAGARAGFATHHGGLNTNEEKELAMRRKMGGGRGVAPPGMGQR